jgi:hypothetical protein
VPLEFPDLSPEVLQVASHVENASCGFMKPDLWSQCEGYFIRCLERNIQQTNPFTSSIKCLIKQAAFLEEKVTADHQSPKLRWIHFVRLSFAMHSNEIGMLPES